SPTLFPCDSDMRFLRCSVSMASSVPPEVAKAFDFPERELPTVEWRHPIIEHSDRRREAVGRRAQINREKVACLDRAILAARKGRGQEILDVGSSNIVDRPKDHVLGQMNEAIPAE